MPQPWKHPKLGSYYFRKVVPVALRAALGRTEIRIPLIPPGSDQATTNAAQAKLLYPDAALRADAMLAAAKGEAVRLPHEKIVALAGEWFRRELKAREVEPGTFEALDGELDLMERAEEAGQPHAFIAPDMDALLQREALKLDDTTREALAGRLFRLKINLLNVLKARTRGNYAAPEVLKELPKWEPPRAAKAQAGDALTFATLIEKWSAERKPAQRTLYEFERAANRLAAHVKHTNPALLTKADIVAWKDALLASGKSPKTTENQILAVSALFGWAVKNEQMGTNPAKGVEVAAKAKAGAKARLPYSNEDAKLLLTAARAEKGARRWVPWLLAFTGARLEEVCQSFVNDVRQLDGQWFLDINADHPTKTLKNDGSARKVPLHQAIIDEGFLAYVRSLPKGSDSPLFPDLTPDRFGRRGGNGTKVIGRWVRAQGITDPRKAPNHSWRHRFKDECRAAEIEKPIHDALTGHASSDEGDGYGLGYPLKVLAAAVAKLPSPV